MSGAGEEARGAGPIVGEGPGLAEGIREDEETGREAARPRAHADLSGVPFPDLVAEMIRRLGDDPTREGMRAPPCACRRRSSS
jgi:hypothetical protein